MCAELSRPWPKSGPGDGRAYNYVEWGAIFDAMWEAGVFYNYANELLAAVAGANSINVGTGAAVVEGIIYTNTAVVNLAPVDAPGGILRKDSIVLEIDYTGGGSTGQYTGRLITKAGDAGGVAYPAMTQTVGVLWQHELYRYLIDDAGAITSLAAVSQFYSRPGGEIDTARLIDGVLSANAAGRAKMADQFVTEAKLNTSVAGAGLAGGGGAALSVNVDNSSIEINVDTLRVKAGGITQAMLAADIKWIKGSVIMWSGNMGAGGDIHYPIDPDTAVVDYHWHLCNGDIQNGVTTPNLTNNFIVAAGGTYAKGATGGAATHTHAVSIASDNGGSHNHTGVTGAPNSYTKQSSDGFGSPTPAHTHTISTQANHQHGVNGNTAAGSTLPPYYALVFLCFVDVP